MPCCTSQPWPHNLTQTASGKSGAVQNTFLDPCSTGNEKLAAIGLLALGVVDPTPGNSGKKVVGPFVDLTTPDRRKHILDGDSTTQGGHRAGTGNPGKSEFPEGRSDDSIMHDISDIATDPTLTKKPGRNGRTITDGTRNGVDIRVVQDSNGDIVTGFPTNTSRNPR